MNVSAVAHGHHAAHKPNANHSAKNFESVLRGQNVRTGATAKKNEAQRGIGCKIRGEDWQTLRTNCLGESSKHERAHRCGLYGTAIDDTQASQSSERDASKYDGLLDINRVDYRAAKYIVNKIKKS